jgi:hypothetical protein
MALVEAEHQQIKHWLTSRFPGGLACPLCRGDMWETNKADGLIANGPPIFLASCKHCGHILLFSPELIKAPIAEPRFVPSTTEPQSGTATPVSVPPLASVPPLQVSPTLNGASPAAGPVHRDIPATAAAPKAGCHV